MRRAAVFVASLLVVPAVAAAEDVPRETLRAAAEKGLVLLEKTSATFIKKGGCNSCHNQMLPAAAQAFARSRGIATGDTIAQLPSEVSETTTERIIEYSGVAAGVNSVGYELFAYGTERRPIDARIEAQIYFLKSMQEPDGSWHATGNRPPLTFDDFTTTAYAINALNAYAPATERTDTASRIARARRWLLEARPATSQERAFHLLGLAWSKADRSAIDKAARGLQGMQARDGGWSQLPAMPTDAYATGQALYALWVGGVPVSAAVYQAGLRYLLGTQAPDGTWHVKTRSLPLQPYFESGYPYGRDQWISAAGAAYAALAIAAAIEPDRTASR
jgi:squalene cyclase